MPKDATKNVDRYKVRGGQLNEFDYSKNQEQFAEQDTKIAKATKGTNSTKSTKENKGVSPKKTGGRKAAKK